MIKTFKDIFEVLMTMEGNSAFELTGNTGKIRFVGKNDTGKILEVKEMNLSNKMFDSIQAILVKQNNN